MSRPRQSPRPDRVPVTDRRRHPALRPWRRTQRWWPRPPRPDVAEVPAAVQADSQELRQKFRPEPRQEPERSPQALALPDFESVVALMREMKEPILETNLRNNVHLVSFEPGRIELRLDEQGATELPNRLSALLRESTGSPWVVSISQAEGAPTLNEQKGSGGAGAPCRDRTASLGAESA